MVKLWIFEHAAGHLGGEVECPPTQPFGSEFEPQWRLDQRSCPRSADAAKESLTLKKHKAIKSLPEAEA